MGKVSKERERKKKALLKKVNGSREAQHKLDKERKKLRKMVKRSQEKNSQVLGDIINGAMNGFTDSRKEEEE